MLSCANAPKRRDVRGRETDGCKRVDRTLEATGLRILKTPVRAPQANAFCERVIGTIRRECLDHVIVFDEESRRRTLRSYLSYYHGSRLHLSLDRDSPDSRSIQSVGEIGAIPEVGGLHHRYERHPDARHRVQDMCWSNHSR